MHTLLPTKNLAFYRITLKLVNILLAKFMSLKKMGVVLKRAHYFITCGGKQMYHTPLEETYITRQLVSVDRKESWEMAHANEGFSQMTLADFGIG